MPMLIYGFDANGNRLPSHDNGRMLSVVTLEQFMEWYKEQYPSVVRIIIDAALS